MVKLAYEFAEKAHKGQKRKSGEDYILHPLSTAITLAEMKMPENIIIAGLLHDVPEDTQYTLDDIKKEFGKDIASMVEGITKVGIIKYRGIERYSENLRHMFVAMAKDIRSIIIKFADRYHNLQTLDAHTNKDKQLRIAAESLEIYAPIAHRLGMGEIKGKLEDEAFKYVYPKEKQLVQEQRNKKIVNANPCLMKDIKVMEKELTNAGIKIISIHGREKHLYSLYQKLKRYDNNIDKIYDLIAMRIIVPSITDCYTALGVVHKKWTPLKGRIKDYISQPKPNGYQSLHTTVFCDHGEILEIQIRTEEMHNEAEYGIASHWQYKDKGKIPDKKIKWIKEFAKLQKEFKNGQQYLDNLQNVKIDVFQNQIYVFTPKGDVIELPENSTPIDFAYTIHTDIGHKCSAAIINDQIARLDTPLRNGDIIEIVLDKNRKYPGSDWLKFVKTQGAKSKIRASLKRQKDSQWTKIIKSIPMIGKK